MTTDPLLNYQMGEDGVLRVLRDDGDGNQFWGLATDADREAYQSLTRQQSLEQITSGLQLPSGWTSQIGDDGTTITAYDPSGTQYAVNPSGTYEGSLNTIVAPSGQNLTPYDQLVAWSQAQHDPLGDFLAQYGPALVGAGVGGLAATGGGTLGAATGVGTADAGLAGTVGSEALYGGAGADALGTGAAAGASSLDGLGGLGEYGLGTDYLGTPMTGAGAVGAGSGINAYSLGLTPEALAAGVGGMGAAGGAAGAGILASAAGALNSALGTTFTSNDMVRALGALGLAGFGAAGADAQSDAYRDVANQYLALGAPFRNQLQASYQPGFDLWSQPGYSDAMNRVADISTRQWSARAGNPAGNPTAQAGIYRDVLNEAFLPALSNYRGQLGQFGGLGLNTSGAASMGSAQEAGGTYDAIGYGLGTLMNPTPNWNDLLRTMQGGSNSNPYALNIGGTPWRS